jgi:hypothetical protein
MIVPVFCNDCRRDMSYAGVSRMATVRGGGSTGRQDSIRRSMDREYSMVAMADSSRGGSLVQDGEA